MKNCRNSSRNLPFVRLPIDIDNVQVHFASTGRGRRAIPSDLKFYTARIQGRVTLGCTEAERRSAFGIVIDKLSIKSESRQIWQVNYLLHVTLKWMRVLCSLDS